MAGSVGGVVRVARVVCASVILMVEDAKIAQSLLMHAHSPQALSAMAPQLHAKLQLPVVFAFLKKALADEHELVAEAFVQTGRELIDAQVTSSCR